MKKDNIIRACVHSGGGSNGSYGVGALKYLIEDLNREYTIFAGVSVGAVNCAHIASFKPQHSRKAIATLYELWRDLETPQVYKNWFPLGPLHALWKLSIYNTAPLHQFIRARLKPTAILATGNKLLVGAVSLTSGRYKLFDETYEDLAGAVLASSAFPLAFCPVELDGELYLDGGIKTVVPIIAAIEAGATHIDVIVTDPPNQPTWNQTKPRIWDLGLRTLGLMVEEITANDILLAQLLYPDVEINVVQPAEGLGDSFDFSSDFNMRRAEVGYRDAKKAIKK